jgi:hypothetical protein
MRLTPAAQLAPGCGAEAQPAARTALPRQGLAAALPQQPAVPLAPGCDAQQPAAAMAVALLRHLHRHPHQRALAQRRQEHRQQQQQQRQRSSLPPLSPCLARRHSSRRQARSLRASERTQRARGAQRSVRGAARAVCASRAVTAREAQARGFAAQALFSALRCAVAAAMRRAFRGQASVWRAS